MSAPARLGLYGAALVAVFAMAFATAGVLVPEHVVQNWVEDTAHDPVDDEESGEHETDEPEEGPGHDH